MKVLALSKDFFTPFCPFFDVAFCTIVSHYKNESKFVEILAFAERYLIIVDLQNKSKKHLFQIYPPVKLAAGRM